MSEPTILVFDSGLGGLTVYREITRVMPHARLVYAADDAVFPYGRLASGELVERVMAVMSHLIGTYRPDIAVIACNTASTLVLPPLRAAFDIPFVGTVPAVKPAAQASRSRRISVLATPGTVARDYTRDLIASYAGDCRVKLVGSAHLASLAEALMAGREVADAAIAAEIAPCFVEDEGGRTDTVVLACTHYPLLLDRFERLAPWPVHWIDPAPAIARRVVQLIGAEGGADAAAGASSQPATAVFTSGQGLNAQLEQALRRYGLSRVVRGALPLEHDADRWMPAIRKNHAGSKD